MRDGNKFKFVSAKMADGSEINPKKYYVGITLGYLLSGDSKIFFFFLYIPRDFKLLG